MGLAVIAVPFLTGLLQPHATVVTAEQRARLWPLLSKDLQHYADYQKRTEREIPLVLLRPGS